MKLGTVIVASVGVTVIVVTLGTQARIPALVSAAVAGGLALGMVQLLAHGMTSPLREMAKAASAMSRGEYGRRVRATSRDEVGELARAFNAMAADLATADRVRRDFVANASHELRTPISSLQATLENIVDGVQPARSETLQTMLRQVERLGRLVAQLLDLSRFESGTVPFDPSPFPLKGLIEDAVDELRLSDPDLELRIVVEPADLVVSGDAERLHQVIANLLENATRHSPTGGVIDVGARRVADGVVIEVADEGPGILPDEAERVFERFYRSDRARTVGDAGAGLGLSIARWIVDAHGGSIRPEQREPRGCRMVVELPVHRP